MVYLTQIYCSFHLHVCFKYDEALESSRSVVTFYKLQISRYSLRGKQKNVVMKSTKWTDCLYLRGFSIPIQVIADFTSM